jgi:hypothetical protein
VPRLELRGARNSGGARGAGRRAPLLNTAAAG